MGAVNPEGAKAKEPMGADEGNIHEMGQSSHTWKENPEKQEDRVRKQYDA